MTLDRPASTNTTSVSSRRERLGPLGLLLFQANFGWMLAAGVSGTLIPALMDEIDPEARIALFGVLTSIGAGAGLLANIVFGALSDRTRSRWGRRNPWILGGGVVAACSLAAISTLTSFPLIVVCYVLFQMGLNALLAPLAAVLPDRVPEHRRGLASALIGFGTLLAQSLGAVVGAAFLSEIRTGLAVVPWIIVVTAVIFVAFGRDSSNRDAPKVVLRGRELLASFRVPRDRDYLLALFGRLMLLLAFYSVVLYQFFILDEYVGLDAAGVASTIAIAGLVMAGSSALGTLVSGPLSDRVGRRKPLVVSASLIIASALVPFIIWPTTTSFLGFIGVGGFAYGIYIAVDQALMSEVLPDGTAHGKDMGILNVANTAPQFIAPGLAGLVLGTGLGYGGLFTVAACVATASAFLIGAIRRVR